MIRYPKLIKEAKEKLACMQADIELRDEQLVEHPDFAITIDGITYTERAEGGEQMQQAIRNSKPGEATAIGSFHGFTLIVKKSFNGFADVCLRGKSEYTMNDSGSPVGSMIKLENLFNNIHSEKEDLEIKIEQYTNDLAASKEEYEKPFLHEKELEEKLARQCELNAQLDLENSKTVDADISGITEETECIKVAELTRSYGRSR